MFKINHISLQSFLKQLSRRFRKANISMSGLIIKTDFYSDDFICIISYLMLFRRLTAFRFGTFFHEFNLGISPEHFGKQTCKLATYVGAYRQYGHYHANLDPLSLSNNSNPDFVRPPDVEIKYQDSLSDYSFSSPITQSSKTIEELQSKLRETYLGTTGVEFDHIINVQEKEWLYSTYETLKIAPLSNDLRVELAKTLVEAEALDLYLHKKWNNFKRYSGEGAESTIVALDQLFRLSSEAGYENVVFGMPHRGRFNLLINILKYNARNLFRKVSGKTDTPIDLRNILDDVTSHISHSITKTYGSKTLDVSMVHNPSHLEAQNPVSMGKTRSKIQHKGKGKILNVIVHGDAAVCAQGINAQSLCLAKTPNYSVDGSIHIITNNQIGYTTRAIDSRPSKYSTDLFKGYDVPIIHVNGENIEDVYRAVSLAVSYQSKFKKDIMLDIICYRKFGHNELDQPEFTQPKMYHAIRKVHKPNTFKYPQELQKEGLVKSTFCEEIRQKKFQEYEEEFKLSTQMQKISLDDCINPTSEGSPSAFTKHWKNMKLSQFGKEFPTAFDIQLLKEYAKASCFLPPDFAIHPRIQKFHIEKRLKSIEENKLDWATCEALAFFTLNSEGHNLRLTGQDVERGTFSQRHINLTDQKDETTFNSLEFFASQQPGRGKVEILNSALSENAVMSYEYGYSIDDPNNFSIWQAQFGDFFNTAQVVVDVLLSNSQNKWLRQSSLTLILPHGFDGMGPQHSSCRIERFLQLANSDGGLKYLPKKNGGSERLKLKDEFFVESIQDANFSIVAPTTPANLFHVLRRQMKRDFRKPLVIAGPKTLLRHTSCLSRFEDIGPGSSFQPMLKYANCDRISECSTVFLVSGKYVYDVQQLIQEKGATKTCLLAIEELYPFPEELLQESLKGLSPSAKIFWIQEENFNGGPYQFVENRVNRVLGNLGVSSELRFVGKRAIACTAVGSVELHKQQCQQLTDWIKELIE